MHEATADNAQAEIGSLRAAVASAERAVQESSAAREAMHAELSSVHHQLAAAREVGRAALTSLQSDLRAPSGVMASAGWLTPILRFIGYREKGHRPGNRRAMRGGADAGT
jgi:hypothetical protein